MELTWVFRCVFHFFFRDAEAVAVVDVEFHFLEDVGDDSGGLWGLRSDSDFSWPAYNGWNPYPCDILHGASLERTQCVGPRKMDLLTSVWPSVVNINEDGEEETTYKIEVVLDEVLLERLKR